MAYIGSMKTIWSRGTAADGDLFNDEFQRIYDDMNEFIGLDGNNYVVVKTDAITEKTVDNGIKIESVLVKDETIDSATGNGVNVEGVLAKDGAVAAATLNADTLNEKTTGNKVIINNSKIIAPTFLFKEWATGSAYITGEMVQIRDNLFKCTGNHTAGTFAADWLTNNYWTSFGDAPGTVKMSSGITTEPGWFSCDGSAKSKSTYGLLWARLYSIKGTCTMTIATPCVVSFSNHGFAGGTRIHFTTSGAMPDGVYANTTYFVSYIDGNTFKLSTSWANYLNGVYVNSSGFQSGTHTLVFAPFGVADAGNFYLPDTKGIFVRGAGTHGTMVNANSLAFSGDFGVMQNDKIQGHKHSINAGGNHRHNNGTADYITSIAVYGATTADMPGSAAYGIEHDGSAIYQGHTSYVTHSHPVSEFSDSLSSDNYNGTPRTGSETNPANIGLNYVIKY